MRDTDLVLCAARSVLDFTKPIAAIFSSVIHFVDDEDDPASLMHAYLEALPDGGFLGLTASVSDWMPPDSIHEMQRLADRYERETLEPAPHIRTTAEIANYFAVDGVTLVPPGIVSLVDWHPDGRHTEEDRARLFRKVDVRRHGPGEEVTGSAGYQPAMHDVLRIPAGTATRPAVRSVWSAQRARPSRTTRFRMRIGAAQRCATRTIRPIRPRIRWRHSC
jgi:hypothetical protein